MKSYSKLLKKMVPAERIELSRAQGPRDFESRASTSFTTPALISNCGKDILKLKNCPPIVNIKMRGAVGGCQWYYRLLLNRFL